MNDAVIRKIKKSFRLQDGFLSRIVGHVLSLCAPCIWRESSSFLWTNTVKSAKAVVPPALPPPLQSEGFISSRSKGIACKKRNSILKADWTHILPLAKRISYFPGFFSCYDSPGAGLWPTRPHPRSRREESLEVILQSDENVTEYPIASNVLGHFFFFLYLNRFLN